MTSRSRHLVAPELLPGLDLLPQMELDDALLAMIRTQMRQGAAPVRPAAPLTPEQAAIGCAEHFVPGAAGAPPVRVLVYTPPGGARDRPAILHLHGGGMVMGNPEFNDAANRALSADHGCVIVSVDYRLAPEARWRDSYEDGYAALGWLFAEAGALGIDTARVAVAGESAGGGHAAALALLARDRGAYPLAFLLLDCPMLDDRTGTAAGPPPGAYTGEFVWTAASNSYGWRALLGQEPGGDDVPAAAVPARAADLAGLPPTFIAIGALDLFLEESLDFVRRLVRAGVAAELHVIPGAYHGYQAAGAEAPQVQAAAGYRRAAIARAFHQAGER